ncbi:hypothetical protein MKX01_003917 [Papaver californicum]|nr:hypothetical protein MKX01_003917 [Papaver californicum]
MYQLLIMVLIVEGIMAFLLVVKIGPFRDLIMKVIDQLKTGKGPEITVKTIVGVMSLILASSVYNFLWIQNKNDKHGTLTPMDQVLVRTHLLDSSLIAFSLFLWFIIYRLHHYLSKMCGLKTKAQFCKEEVEKLQLKIKEKEEKASKERRLLNEEVSKLKENLKKIKSESEEKDKRVLAAESDVAALQKQSNDLLLEYDRLLEDNQNLQSQNLGYR